MSIHLIKDSGPPTVIPIELGCHYIDTANKKSYISVGTGSVGDWRETAGGGGGGGGSVSSVFGRIGDIVAQSGDYTAAQVGAYSTTQVDSALAGKVSSNPAITGNTHTKITYDSKGLVVAGANLSGSDIPAFTGATSGSPGTLGGVPAPLESERFRFLRGDGTWHVVPDAVTSVNSRSGDVTLTGTDIPAFTGSLSAGSPGTQGSVPAPNDTDALKFLRGDGTWAAVTGGVSSVNGQTGVVNLTKNDIGLGNVDNTSDANKPVSTATQTALNAKVTANGAITGGTFPKITFDAKGLVTAGSSLAASDIPLFIGATGVAAGTRGAVPPPSAGQTTLFLRSDGNWAAAGGGGGGAVDSVNGRTGAVVLTSSDVGLGNVDNTSDANKPISTATQTALNAKVTANAPISGGTNTKITFDAKGLVTAGSSLSNTDIPAFTGATSGSAGSLGGVPASLAGDEGKFLRADGTWQTVSGGGGGTPAGSNTWVQFNNSGAFGASINFTWDSVNGLTVTGSDTSATTPGFTVRDSTAVIEFQVRNSGLLTGTTIDTGTVGNCVRIGVGTTSTVAYTDSVFIGRGAGVGAGTAAVSNSVYIGALSGNKVTTGSGNTGVGFSALTAVTTGGTNTAVGQNALRVLTTATGCTAIGSGALNANTGTNNTALGTSAGFSNIDGINNTFIGQFAAGTAQYVQSSIYIGVSCTATNGTVGAKTINEIVIGNSTVGRGNNTVTIGTTSTTNNQFWGDLILVGSGKGLRLTSPNGTTTKTITIDNSGAIVLI